MVSQGPPGGPGSSRVVPKRPQGLSRGPQQASSNPPGGALKAPRGPKMASYPSIGGSRWLSNSIAKSLVSPREFGGKHILEFYNNN